MKSIIHTCKDLSVLRETLLEKGRTFVIIDNNLQHIAEYFKDFPLFFIGFSEQVKTLDTVARIAAWLLEQGADRDALIIGVGGGLATDITGFTASIYKRGVRAAFVPTTLLAQVDASIGGKNGVNFNSYKNILGTITQPQWIYICPEMLRTLPENEFKAGIAEVLKTFILFDRELYRTSVEYFSEVAQRYAQEGKAGGKPYGSVAAEVDLELLTRITGKCAEYKCGVVERDEFERGERRLLNLGHTFAHAIEKLTSGEISHGFAVSIGLVLAAGVAETMGMADRNFVASVGKDLRRVGLPASLADCPSTSHLKVADLVQAVGKDKKVTGKSIHFILPKGIQDVEDAVIPLETIKQIADDLC